MKIRKGQYGYRDQHKKSRALLTGLFAAAIIAQLIARQMASEQAAKNILTVMAILTVLPMANLASPLLASWKYRTADRSFYAKAHAYEEKCTMLYDLIVTTKEQILPLDAVAVHPNGVFAFCSSEKADLAKAEKAVNALFQANKLDPNVKLIRDPHAFFRRLDSLKPASEYEDDGVVDYAAALMKNLSM